MKCPNCGAFLMPGMQACPNCGALLTPTGTNNTLPVQPQPMPTQPTQPVQPQPMPAQPTQPVQPQPMPTQPTQPVQPQPMPAQPTQPVQPQPMPAQPTQPVQPQPMSAQPVQPQSMPTQPVQPVINPAPTQKGKPKSKGVGVVVVLLIAALATAYYLYTPKVRFLAAITNTSDTFFEAMDTQNNEILSLAKEKNTEIDSTVTLTTEGIDAFLGMDFDLKLETNVINAPEKKELVFDLEYFENDIDIIGMNGLLNKEKLYIMVKDVMNNYYYTDGKYTNIFDFQDYEDYQYLIEIVKKSINQTLSDGDFKTSKEKTTLGEKEFKLTKISLAVNEKMVQKIFIKSLTNIKNDEKAIKILIKMTGSPKTEKEMKKGLIDAIKEIEEGASNKTYFTYNIYIKGYNTIYCHEIIEEDDNSLRYEDYVLDDKKYKRVVVVTDGEEEFKLTYKEVGKGKYQINGNYSDYLTFSGTVINKNDKLEVIVGFSSSGEEIALKFTNESKEIKKDKEYTGKTSFTISYDYINVMLATDNHYKFDASVPKIDVSKAKYIENVTEEETNAIIEKLKKSTMSTLFIPESLPPLQQTDL